LRKNKGFTLAEVLIAMSILFTVILSITPITSVLEKEQDILNDKRLISLQLHDELQPFLWNNRQIPAANMRKINNKNVTFEFKHQNEYVKGCAKWENAKQINDQICIYGIPS